MRSIKRVASASATALVIAMSGALVPASPAMAMPENCWIQVHHYGYGGWAYGGCSGGWGQYSASAMCSATPDTQFKSLHRGPAYGVGSGMTSFVYCGGSTPYLRNAWMSSWE